MPVAECSWHPWPTASCDFEQFPKLFLLRGVELFAEQRCSLNTLYELSLVIIEIFLFGSFPKFWGIRSRGPYHRRGHMRLVGHDYNRCMYYGRGVDCPWELMPTNTHRVKVGIFRLQKKSNSNCCEISRMACCGCVRVTTLFRVQCLADAPKLCAMDGMRRVRAFRQHW